MLKRRVSLITNFLFATDQVQDEESKDKDTWVELKEKVEDTLKGFLKVFSKFTTNTEKDTEIANETAKKHKLETYESLLLQDC